MFVPDELVLGEVGQGWAQNTSELAYERGGPERWLSTYLIVEEFLRSTTRTALGRAGRASCSVSAVARWWALRQLSLSVARTIDRGEAPAAQAALVKEMGTRFEQDVLAGVERLVEIEPSRESASLFERLLAEAVLTSPSFTIRGGTDEILRSVAAKGLAGREQRHRPVLIDGAERVCSPAPARTRRVQAAEARRLAPAIWSAVAAIGLP